jgi:chromosome partitioning protein
MKIISFVNMKGGVGKTTLAVNVACGLAMLHRKNVLLVDGDPQFNATTYLLEDDAYLKHLEDETKGTLKEIFVPQRHGPINTKTGKSKPIDKRRMPLSDCTVSIFNGGTGRGKLDLLPSTLQLVDSENLPRGAERKLSTFLKEKAKHYDFVLIDCPPTITVFTQAAILASDKYLVPIKPDPLSVIGLPLLERWLEEFAYDNGIDIETLGLVFTMVRGPAPARMKEVMAALHKERKQEVFQPYLSQSTYVSSSVEAHEPIFRYKKSSKVSQQIQAIIQEFLARA